MTNGSPAPANDRLGLRSLKEGRPTSPIVYVVIALGIWIIDYFTLRNFQGYILKFPEMFSWKLLAAVLFAFIVGAVFQKNRAHFTAIFISMFVSSYLVLIGAYIFAALHLLLVITFAALMLSEDKGDSEQYNKDLIQLAIVLFIDFFGYALIGQLNSFIKAPAEIFFNFQNRLIIPVWTFFILGKKGGRAGSIILILMIFFNMIVFIDGISNIQNEIVNLETLPEQVELAETHFLGIFDRFLMIVYDPIACIWEISDATSYQKCVQERAETRTATRKCQSIIKIDPSRKLDECVAEELARKKTSGAVDRTIKEYVDVSLEKSTTKKQFTMGDDIEIIYKLKVKSTQVPIVFSDIKCEFTNLETKEKSVGYARSTLPMNQETKITSGGVFITCILLNENKKPGKYTNTVTAEIQDVDTYATLALYFMGNVKLLNSQIGLGDYQEQLINEKKLWPNEINTILVDGKVQSRAYPGLIWPRIGEPLDNNQISTLPIKRLREGESIQLLMSVINKATGKITGIRDIILELPQHSTIAAQGACARFHAIGDNSYSIAQTDGGKRWLEFKVKSLSEQKQETEENLLSCNIQITNYPLFIDNPNNPSGPKYFTVRIEDYDYQIQKEHNFEIEK